MRELYSIIQKFQNKKYKNEKCDDLLFHTSLKSKNTKNQQFGVTVGMINQVNYCDYMNISILSKQF